MPLFHPYKYLFRLNSIFASALSFKKYFFFLKYIYPLFLFTKIDFSLSYSFNKKKNFYQVKSSKSSTGYYFDISRSNRYIFGGFNGMGKILYKKYQLNKVDIKKNDVVIEIGANIGELTKYISKFSPRIYAIDIELKLLSCLSENLRNYKPIKIFNLAIWNCSEIKEYESKLHQASSSLIIKKKNKNYLNIKKIKSLTLEDFLNQNNIKKVKLVKVEAEGGEPEILQGAKNCLNKIKYLSLDCGPERHGKKTLKYAVNFLKKNNFKVEVSGNYCLGVNKKLS
jgi:FkbM family methyltransferase